MVKEIQKNQESELNSVDNIEKERKNEINKHLVNITDISFNKLNNNDLSGYVINNSFNGKAIKKSDLNRINEEYNQKLKMIQPEKNGEVESDTTKNNESEHKNVIDKTEIKQAEKELSKLKIDNTLITNRKNELTTKGYPETEAKEIAELESIIDLSNKRISILEKFPDLKDQSKRLISVKKALEESLEKLNELFKKNESLEIKNNEDENNINENQISNKQKIRNAEEEIRKISRDEKNINEIKIALINQGHPEEAAIKMAELIDAISGDEKRKEILLNNPRIQNGQKELSAVEKRLENNKKILEELKTNTVKSNPQNPDDKNQKAAEKESAIKIAKDKLLGFFRRKEKQKVEVYTEEEENAWRLFIKTELEKGTSMQEIQELNLKHLEEKRKLEVEKGPLSARVKSGISKGIESWDNWGNEGGWSGYAKKMGKMVVSIGLIAGVSTFSVEKAAGLGLGTASALASGRIGKKLLIGLGLGTAMELTNGMNPEKRKKIQKIVSLSMMAISAGIAIASGGGIIAGAAVGGSAAFGYMSSKLVQKRFSEEKIKTKLDNIKKREINLATLDEDLAKIENETREILKQAENTRLWRKVLGGAVAIGGSVAVLEASGYVHDLKTEHQESEQQKIDDFNNKHEANVKHIADMNEKHLQHEAEMKHQAEQAEQQVKNNSETQNNQSENNNQTAETETNNSTQGVNIQEFMKSSATEDAIKLGMYNPESLNESMIVQSGTVSFDADGHHVEVPYSSDGAIQTIADLKEKMIAEFGGEEKIPHGNMTTHYIDMKGIEHDQSLIHSDAGGAETAEKFKGDMFNSDHSAHKLETTTDTNTDHHDYKVPEQVNPETGEHINTDVVNNTETPNNNSIIPPQINPETGLPMDNNTVNNHGAGSENHQHVNSGENSNILTPDMLEQIERTSEYNLDRLFPTDEAINQWYNIKTIDATIITHIHGDEVSEIYKPLVEYVHNLQKITGITNPYEATRITPAENISQYIERALQKAASDPKIGLDKVTL